jgi:hypothetical protein
MPDAHGGRRRVHLQTLSITPVSQACIPGE